MNADIDNVAREAEPEELSDDLAEDGDDDLPAFDLGLSPAGDEGSSFRTQNDPTAPLQRNNYIERKGAVDVRCSCLDVIHGTFSADGAAFATLLVLQFRFDPRKRARRFESADISLEFDGMKPGQTGPEVFAIAPAEKLSLLPTTQHEEVSQTAEAQLGGAAPVGGVTGTGTLGWQKTVSRDTSDQTTVTGSIDLKGRNWGRSNCASWTLLENKTAKTGIPASIRTAILLKRDDEEPFQCIVKLNASVDFKSTLERVFGGKGRTPRDDPVLFDPTMEPTNKLYTYNIEELGKFDLESVCDITFSTTLGGTVKEKTF
ncbi:MAG: hypothetical protein M1833_000695 [Piccolia ochrophora]|nr:MAG: hypothetical protein M1833_000695 [Piccolia ochrophora]